MTKFLEVRVLLHSDLAALVYELARASGESLEGYIETVLREKTGFTGPRSSIYTAQKLRPDEG